MGYTISEDSPAKRAVVDGLTLEFGGDPVELTDDQAKRLADAGVQLTKDGSKSSNTTPTEEA